MAKNTSSASTNTKAIKLSCKWLSIVATSFLLSSCLDGHDTSVASSEDSPVEFGDEYWAELAAGLPAYIGPPGAAEPVEERINVGNWGNLVEWPVIATGAANMPDGNVVAWASFKKDSFQLTQDEQKAVDNGSLIVDQESTHGTIYNPNSNSFSPLFSSSHDMFCAGVSMLDDGDIFVAGGGDKVSSTSIFSNGQFSEVDSMNQTRWYPTSTSFAVPGKVDRRRRLAIIG